MKYYLINLDAKEICGASENQEELIAQGEKASWAYHVCKAEEFAGCTLHDLAQYYNRLPGATTKVEKHRDRPTAIKRINEVIEKGGLCELREGKPVKTRKKREEGSKVGRKSWNAITYVPGNGDKVRFQKKSPRFQVLEIIQDKKEIGRDELVKLCEEKLGIKHHQVLGVVSKLLNRKVISVK